MNQTNASEIRIGNVQRTEDGEYFVPVFVNGKRSEAKTYYAADRGDAVSTRDAMLCELEARRSVESRAEDDARAVLALVRFCAKNKAEVAIVDRDDGPQTVDPNFTYEAAAEILACDEAMVRVQIGESRCTVFLVFGNGDDTTLTDYTDNALGARINAALAPRSL